MNPYPEQLMLCKAVSRSLPMTGWQKVKTDFVDSSNTIRAGFRDSALVSQPIASGKMVFQYLFVTVRQATRMTYLIV